MLTSYKRTSNLPNLIHGLFWPVRMLACVFREIVFFFSIVLCTSSFRRGDLRPQGPKLVPVAPLQSSNAERHEVVLQIADSQVRAVARDCHATRTGQRPQCPCPFTYTPRDETFPLRAFELASLCNDPRATPRKDFDLCRTLSGCPGQV